ncbi:MarR family winged helix-turn-helix transcriptional regulator [Ornithinimicrobium sediminis]|uniref:MarR family winged helix-turn-helix transcriptional regulator n=1 Tax=Ornithinimicrobium sediminis TaxID=2904603 RepID=UPI001E3E3D7F|nr:MarR family transcriptional regulator [Ornithinimicrobium sediminis]MCE0487206.1 MarR family transcriptional regulator [Ornithinimicrobium sediminis]
MVTPERAALVARIADTDTRVRHLMLRWAGPLQVPSDLTLRQLQVLGLLHGHDGVTGHELAETLGVSTATVSGLVERMVGKHLVRRSPDPDDRRKVLLSVTPEGQQVLQGLDAASSAGRDRLLERLDPADLAELARLFDLLLRAAEEVEAEATGAQDTR